VRPFAVRGSHLTIFFLAAVLAAGSSGCVPSDESSKRQSGGTSTTAAQGQPRTFRIVVSGDTRGFIVPCGCASKQLGGLPRRATFLGSLSEDRLYVDAGGSAARAFEYDRLKVEFIWRGMESMSVAALNLGASEVAFGKEFLDTAIAKADLPFVSSNVCDENGVPLVPTFRRLEVGGARVALLGVCSASYAGGEGLRLIEPKEALREPIEQLRPGVDLLILLAQAPEAELRVLAETYPELDAVLATGQSQPISPRLLHERTLLAGVGIKGKFLASVPWHPEGGHPEGGPPEGERHRWVPGEGRIVEVADSIPEHAELTALVGEYQVALRNASLPPEKTGEVVTLLASLPGDYRYAGSESCLTCHELEGDIWKKSPHAHGLETLDEKGFEADPYCVRCHTTGYGGPGGYRTLTERRTRGGVGCESCHGPSQAHMRSPETRSTSARASEACITCHDPENSPEFSFDVYWPKIVHGKRRKPEVLNSAAVGGSPDPPTQRAADENHQRSNAGISKDE